MEDLQVGEPNQINRQAQAAAYGRALGKQWWSNSELPRRMATALGIQGLEWALK